MSSLNVRRTGQDEYGTFVKALICGDPGAGKTLISSTAPGVLYASAEGGLMSVADRQVPFIEITKSDELNRLRPILSLAPAEREKQLGIPVDTIVIDTIDEVQKILARERLDEERKEQLAQADWGWLGDQVRGLVRGFRNLPLNVIFTCHLKSTEDSVTGATFFKPALQGAMGDEIPAYVDLAVLLRTHTVAEVVDGQARKRVVRVMQTYKDPNYPWIKDRSGKLPNEFELNFNDDFTRIIQTIFGGAAIQPSADVSSIEEERKAEAKTKTATKPKGELPLEEPKAAKSDAKIPEPKSDSKPEPETATSGEPAPQTEPASSEAPEAPEQALASETAPAPAAEPDAATGPTCSECNTDITQDEADLSELRYHKPLCTAHFKARKTAARK